MRLHYSGGNPLQRYPAVSLVSCADTLDSVNYYSKEENAKIKIVIVPLVIAVVIALFVIAAVVVYACCVVAGRSDDAAERWMREHDR